MPLFLTIPKLENPIPALEISSALLNNLSTSSAWPYPMTISPFLPRIST